MVKTASEKGPFFFCGVDFREKLVYPGSVTRKGFFASIAGAVFGSKVPPSKGIPWRHGVGFGVPSAINGVTSYQFVYTAVMEPGGQYAPWKWRVVDAPIEVKN